MSSFRVLNLRYIRRQPLRATLAVAAIAAAVTMSVAVLILVASLDRSIAEALKGLSGPAPVRVVGPLTRGGVDPSTIERVAATEGVQDAVPVVQAVAIAQQVGGEPTHIVALGVDCQIEALVGAFGCDDPAMNPRRDGPALVSASLTRQVGAGADIRTNDGRVPIEGAVVNDALDEVNDGRIAIFEMRTAQRLFDRGKNVDAVYILPQPGADVGKLVERLRSRVGPTNLVLRADDASPWMSTRGPLIPLLGLALTIALGLSGLLVYNILALSLADRRRDLAVASAIGTSPRALIAGVVGESTLLGLAGGIIGLPVGLYFAKLLVDSFAALITEAATGITPVLYVPLRAPVAGLLIGAGVGAFAAIVPARRAMRLDLAAELHGRALIAEGAVKRSWTRVAVLLACVALAMGLSALSIQGGGLEAWQPALGALALLGTAVLVAATVGALAPTVVVAVLRSMRDLGGPLRVALANLVSRPQRTTVIATAVGSAVGMACLLGALIPATRATVLQSELSGSRDEVLVSTLPLNNAGNVDARPSELLLRRIQEVPGVSRIDRGFSQEISDDRGVYSVRAFEDVERWTFEPIRGETGDVPLARGDAVVGTSLARARGLRPGSSLRIATPTGFVGVRVAGIWASSFDNGHSAIVSPERFERLFGFPAPHAVNVVASPGVSTEELALRIEAANLDPDITVRTGTQAANALADEIGEQAAPFWTLQRLLLFVALVGTLSTLLLVGVQRRRELGVLGAVGFSPLELGRMTLTEALAAGLAGALLGAIGSLAGFEVLRNASAVSVGVRTEFSFAPLSAVGATALAAAVVAVGAALPAWRAARLQIVEAIRDE